MAALIRVELRKLIRPVTAGVMVFFAAIAVLSAWTGQRNYEEFTEGLTPVPPCANFGLEESSARCEEIREEFREAYAESYAIQRSMWDLIGANLAVQRHPLGALGVASGHAASAAGALIVIVLGSGHVAGEWSRRTVSWPLLFERRRWRVLLAKVVSLWAAAVIVVLVAWVAIAAVLAVTSSSGALGRHSAGWGDAALYSAGWGGRAALALAFYSAMVVLASVLTRTTLGAVGLSGGVLVIGAVLAHQPGVGRFSPVSWLAGLMGLPRGHESLVAYIWLDAVPHISTMGASIVVLASATLLMLVAAGWLFCRQDVTS